MPEEKVRLRKADRHERILLELRLRPHLRLSELADDFGVASETIRRDVAELEAAGQVSRAFGGVTPLDPSGRPDVDTRNRQRLEERARIARSAASLIEPEAVVMLDAGSTTQQLARVLAFERRKLSVITNSLNVAMILGRNPLAHIRLCPGELLAKEAAVVGQEAVDFLRRFHVAQAFVGASAVGPNGVTEAVPGFAAIKRTMREQSERLIVMADSSKFARTDSDLVARFAPDITLVTEAEPDGETRHAIEVAGTRVVRA